MGPCGEPKVPLLPDHEKFHGDIFHSSNLDGNDAEDKKVLIVGGGASTVEALQWAMDTEAKHISVLARSEKWYVIFKERLVIPLTYYSGSYLETP